MSGEPIPNSLLELFSQYYLLDKGESLGLTKQDYLDRYFKQKDRDGRVFEVKNATCKAEIYRRIAPKSVSLEIKNTAYELNYINQEIKLPPEIIKIYHEFEAELFLEFESGEINAFNIATKMQKLHQLTQGFVYSDEGNTILIHDKKLRAVQSALPLEESALIAIGYVAEAERYAEKLNCPIIYGRNTREHKKLIRDFTSGKTQYLVINPKSLSEGVDGFQTVCRTIIWPYITFSYRDFSQLNGRLARNGQTKTVNIHSIIAKNTIDVFIRQALAKKKEGNRQLLEYVRNYCGKRVVD